MFGFHFGSKLRLRALTPMVGFAALTLCAHAADFTLFAGGEAPTVIYEASGGAPIAKAAELLGHDLSSLTKHAPQVTASFADAPGAAIVVGLASSPSMAALLRANHISVAPSAGQWETYGRAVVPAPWNAQKKVLVIFGSDVRGTVWGVIDLTREMGISAWEWWADVTPRATDHLVVSAATSYSKTPTVQYRGIFLNAGKNGLEPWAANVYDPGSGRLGPKSYSKIYELMWRLKANAIWPFMGEFNENPENYRAAADYAIVRGSSHVEMLLRTNGPEWNDSRGAYNWFTNRQGMIDYWTEAMQRYGKFENMYTVGLRDKDDFPMEGVKTPAQVGEALTDVIAEQRKILSKAIGKPADQIPQALTLYKEVLPAYTSGKLKLPDDVTMIWPEDDFGYIRQLSDAEQRRRSGGSGVYYHADFWGPPMSYLWIGASDPSLMWEEMNKAVRFDARKTWILNVGSIKPLEFLTEFFMAIAFDADAYRDGHSVRAYLQRWVTGNFGPEHAEAVTDLMWRFYKLAFDRNPEFMAWTEVFPETPVKQTEYNLLDFGDENARRSAAYLKLMDEAQAIMAVLPADRKDAFFELIQYPVNIAGDLNLRQLYLDKSIAYGLQHRASADVYAQMALAAHMAAQRDSHYFNTDLAGGKWQGWINTAHQDLPVFETPHVPTWSTGGPTRWGVQVEGGEYIDSAAWWMANMPLFHVELPRPRYIDVFVTAPVDATWTATPSVPWIKVDRSSGTFSPQGKKLEDRIQVSIDWSIAPKGESLPQLGVLRDPIGAKGDVIVTCSAGSQKYAVHVLIAPPNEVPHVSFMEEDRIVSMYAIHPDARSGNWEVLDGFAHYGVGSSIRTSLGMKSIDPRNAAAVRAAPSLTYRFATSTPDDQATFTAIAIPTYPITSENGVRIAVSIDGATPEVLDLGAPEYSQGWRQHALSNKAIMSIGNLHLAPGAHTAVVYALDPGVTLDRFEVSFFGAQRAYGAVPETRLSTAR